MTPIRAKRNSKAPERFTSDEAKVDTPNNHVNSKQGKDKSDSVMKTMPLVREPLKVKLPKLKRPHPMPQQIKVKISRVNGNNRNVANAGQATKIKLSVETSINNNNLVNKTNSPKSVSKNWKQCDTSRIESHRTSDLKISLPKKAIYDKKPGRVQELETNLNDSSESDSSNEHDINHEKDPDSSFSSRNSDGSAMQIIVERKTEQNNSGIRCPCGVEDDLGVMVECEKCSTWQHGHCINVCSEEDAYEGYVCGYCLFPDNQHTVSLQQLTVGDRFQSKFDSLELLMRKKTEIPIEQRGTADENRVEFTFSELEQAVQDLRRVFNSLKVKWKLLTNDDYTAELKIWQHPIWSDNPEENLKQQQQQTVSFVGDIYKSNLRLHLSNLLSNMQKRCQLIRYQVMETHAPDSKLDNLLMILDDISKVVERYSDEIRQN